jgi:hypothetical protein
LVRKREEYVPLGRASLEDTIEINPKETGLVDVDWIHLAHDGDMRRTLVKAVINFRVSKSARNLLTS